MGKMCKGKLWKIARKSEAYSKSEKNLFLQHKILDDVNCGIYSLMKKVQKKHGLSWAKAKSHVNQTIISIYGNGIKNEVQK